MQIGNIFAHYVSLGWHCFEGDYSRYDGHTEIEALQAELDYYEPALSPETHETLRMKLNTTGRSSSGVRFYHKGKMCSGLISTSFGNTIRGFMIVAGYCRKFGIPLSHIVVVQLGDDNIIFVKDPDEFNLKRFIDYASMLGHKLEMVYRPDPDLAEYCSMRFWNIGSGRYVLGPKPARVLAKTFVCHDRSLTVEDMPSYCKEIAVGMRAYSWIPILGTMLHRVASIDAKATMRVQQAVSRANKDASYKVLMPQEEIDIDISAVYAQFEKVYGFDPKPLEGAIEDMDMQWGVGYHCEGFDIMNEVDGVTGEGTNYE